MLLSSFVPKKDSRWLGATLSHLVSQSSTWNMLLGVHLELQLAIVMIFLEPLDLITIAFGPFAETRILADMVHLQSSGLCWILKIFLFLELVVELMPYSIASRNLYPHWSPNSIRSHLRNRCHP